MKKTNQKITLPKTKFSEKTGLFKVTPTGYVKSKNGKILPLKFISKDASTKK